MKQKILYSIISMFLLFGFAAAQEIKSTTMPTDAEIWESLNQLKLTPQEKQQVFNDTKKILMEAHQKAAQKPVVINGKKYNNPKGIFALPDKAY